MNILMPFWLKTGNVHSFYAHFAAGLTEAARELGHSVSQFEFAIPGQILPEERNRLHRMVMMEDFDFVLDLSCKGGVHFSESVWDGSEAGEPLLDSVELPYVGMLLDQVYLQAMLPLVRAERVYLTLPDEFHNEQLALVYPELKPVATVVSPPAVRPRDERPSAPWLRRDIDLLYVGNIDTDTLKRRWRSEPDAKVFDAVADHALADPAKPLHRCYLEVAGSMGLQPTQKLALLILPRVESFLRARFRHDLVVAVAGSGMSLCLVGRGWNELPLPENVSWRAPVDYEGVLALYGQSRICLEASTYLGGASDRIFGIAINGAVCATNTDRYLSRSYGSDGGPLFYDLRHLDILVDSLRSLLATGTGSAARADEARRITLAQHTWRNRLEAIVKLISA